MDSVSDSEKNTLLVQRYGEQPDGDYPWNQTISLLLKHVSVRHFLKKHIPEHTLETLMAAAQSASTGSLLHSWSVVAVTNPDRKSHVALLCGDQQFIREAPLFLLFCADLSRMSEASAMYNPPGSGQGLNYVDLFVMANLDAAMAAQNAAIAVESLGLGMCYVGGARNNASDLAEYLKLPERVIGLFGMAVGYADASKANAPKPRIPREGVLHRETWDNQKRRESTAKYEGILQAHYNRHHKEGRMPWGKHVANFVKTGDLDGRERYRDVLNDQGFSLN